jgi:HK97 gp10 family phage protein
MYIGKFNARRWKMADWFGTNDYLNDHNVSSYAGARVKPTGYHEAQGRHDAYWGIDTSELDGLVAQLDAVGANLEAIGKKAVDATIPIIRDEMASRMKKSSKPRKVSARESWRTEVHAADAIEVTRPRISLRGSIYRVIGPQRKDNSKHFYMKFFEYGRRVYDRGTGVSTTFIPPDSYVNPTLAAVSRPVIETIRTILLKEIGFYG